MCAFVECSINTTVNFKSALLRKLKRANSKVQAGVLYQNGHGLTVITSQTVIISLKMNGWFGGGYSVCYVYIVILYIVVLDSPLDSQ